jgi:hypothetical protein
MTMKYRNFDIHSLIFCFLFETILYTFQFLVEYFLSNGNLFDVNIFNDKKFTMTEKLNLDQFSNL